MMAELLPCPKCNGEIKLYSRCGVGAVAECQKCKEEFVVCGMEELKIYNGCKIRSSTVRKIEKMWNKQATRTPKETHEKHTQTHDNTPKERGGEK